MIKDYIQLMKPGIIIGNLITSMGGFLLASKGHFEYKFFWMILGLSLIIGSGCVFNNYHDRKIDEKMNRTKNRALVKKTISPIQALIFGTFLLIISIVILGLKTNFLTLVTALIGFIVYVLIYSPLKIRSVHGTLIGSVAGAIPPVVGYVAYSGRYDLGAFLLFLIITFWQMPHFYAISIYRLNEYGEAKVPVLPRVKGLMATKKQIFLYTFLFLIAVILLSITGYT